MKGHSSVTETSAGVISEYKSLKRPYDASSKFVAMPYALVYSDLELDNKAHRYLMQLVYGENLIEYFAKIREDRFSYKAKKINKCRFC